MPGTRTVTTEVRVKTLNVPRKTRNKGIRAAWADATRGVDIVFMQEVFSRRQKTLLAELAERDGFEQVGLWASPNPIFYRKSVWKKTGADVIELHKRLVWWRKWPGYSAARYATTIGLEHRKTKLDIGGCNTHLVPRGKKVEPRSRERARTKSKARLTEIADRHVARGWLFILGGDINITPSQFKIKGVKWMVNTIDVLGFRVPPKADYKVAAAAAARFPAPTVDHKHGTSMVLRIEEER